MPVSIVRQRLLRTGDLGFSATEANTTDQYMVVVDERISKEEMAELWVATSGNPIPRGTLKQLGSNYLICDRIRCNSAPNQGYIWKVFVDWKELEKDEPDQQSTPTPNNGSTDPEDWTPTWQRRTVVVFEPADRATYIDGYSITGAAAAFFPGATDADGKHAIRNSALQPFVEKQEHRRRMYIWTFRWLRASIPSNLVAAEGKINSASFTISIGGVSFAWAAKTALIDSVNVSKMRWGNTNLVEINVEIAHDPKGWLWNIRDVGTAARAYPGDPGVTGTLLDEGKPPFKAITDDKNKMIQDPVDLDGDGQPAQDGVVVFGRWSDYAEVAFDGLALIGDLGS
jgi:hypothetical protein